MLMTAGRLLAPAVLIVALGLSPALGYATTHVLLALGAVATVLGMREFRIDTVATLFAAAFALIAISALATMRSPADLVPLLGLAALLFYGPLVAALRGTDKLHRFALIGAGVGLATALVHRYGLGMNRAAEGFWLTDPYRLAVTTVICAVFGLGGWFAQDRWRWLSLFGPVAAVAVIALTGSRTALLGLPVLLLVTTLCLARRPAAIAATLGAAVAAFAVILSVQLPGTARTSLWDVASTIARGGAVEDAAINIRIGLYRAGAELFAKSPLAGSGWTEAMMEPVRAQLTPEQLRWGQVVHLHNDAMQFAVSGGVLGLAAWLMILVAPLAGYLRLPREARTPQMRHGIPTLVIGYLVLGLPDTMLAAPLTLTLYVVLTAATLGGRRGPTA